MTPLFSKKELSRFARLGALASVTMIGVANASSALPAGASVKSGTVGIRTDGANAMTVRQTSPAAIINWTEFSIGRGASVNFENGAGATLNRVTGDLPSRIDGSLNATGSVYLVNRSGVVIGESGRVQTGGSFIASTLDVADAAFLSGGDLTFAGDSQAVVINAGAIGSLGGDVALIARRVDNAGTLSANQGTAALAAGYEVLVRDAAALGGKFLVKVGGADTRASNAGRIEATVAELRANGGSVYALAGNTAGLIKATRVNRAGGRIVFDAGHTGTVDIAGRVDATGAGAAGGTITATGSRVDVRRDATLDASGTTGGILLIGGDYQGGHTGKHLLDESLSTAEHTRVESGAHLVANGSQADGGAVVVWAEDTTVFAGHLSAIGAIRGGTAEVSGKNTLTYAGTVNLSGGVANGSLLLDPNDITISTAPDDANTVNTATLQASLATANVTISTTAGSGGAGNITVTNAITWTSASVLTLQADNTITINAPINATNGGLTLSARSTIQDVSVGTITTGAAGAVNVGAFILQQGTWRQVGTLPAFSATKDFQIVGANSATNDKTAFFLRFSAGDGLSDTTPFVISDIYGLQGLAGGSANTTTANNGNTLKNAPMLGTSTVTPYYALGNAIDATVTKDWNAGQGFRPIGGIGSSSPNAASLHAQSGGPSFRGNFNGRGFTLSGLTINRPNSTLTGLFGYVVSSSDTTGVVTNLRLDNASITGYKGTSTLAHIATGAVVANTNAGKFSSLRVSNSTVSGNQGVGGVVGRLGSYTGGASITDSFFTGSVTGTADVGGLVGSMAGSSGEISNCYAAATVTASGNYAGGLVGRSIAIVPVSASGSDPISNSYATGSVTGADFVGGLVGSTQGTVSNSYAASVVTATGGTNLAVGGLIGEAFTAPTGSYWNTTLASVANGAMDGNGGAVGGATGLTSAQMQNASNFPALDFTNVWNTPTGGAFPTLKVFNAPAVTNITYAIANAGWTYGATPGTIVPVFTGVAAGDSIAGVLVVTGSSGVVTLNQLIGAGTYTLSLSGLTGADAAKYAIATTGNTTGTLTIARAPLSISADSLTKTYGDTATLTYAVSGLRNSDTVTGATLSSTGAAATAGVNGGTPYAVTVAAATGTGLANYDITYTPGTITVNPAALTITADSVAQKKFSDSLTFSGTEFTATGLKNSDTVVSAALTSAGAAAGSATGTYDIGISGAVAGVGSLANYAITYVPGKLTVTPDFVDITYAVGNATSTYGTLAILPSATLSGVSAGDAANVHPVVALRTLGGTPVTLANLTAAGTYSIYVSGLTGSAAGLYQVVETGSTAGTLVINPLAIGIINGGSLAASKVYDGTAVAAVASHGTLQGVIASDTAKVDLKLTANFADKNAGTGKTVTGSYTLTGEAAANYTLSGDTTFAGTQDITRAAVTIGGAATLAASKTYDGTTAALVSGQATLVGILAIDAGKVGATLGASFANKGAGVSKAVTGTYALTGDEAGNYTLADASFSGIQTVATRTVTLATAARIADKTYDGTTAATVGAAGAVTGVIVGDSVSLAVNNAVFTNKNAGTGKTVTGVYALTGDDAVNYTLDAAAFAGTAAINRAELTVATGAVVRDSKVYDGTTGIVVLSGGTLSGVIGSDNVRSILTGAAYADKNAGSDKTVTGRYALAGTDAGNYTLSTADYTGTAAISRATLTYRATPATRLRGQPNPAFTGSVTGFVGGDTATSATSGRLTFTAEATSASPAGVYAIAGSGLSATNYAFVQADGNATALTVKPLTTTGGVEIPDTQALAGIIAVKPMLEDSGNPELKPYAPPAPNAAKPDDAKSRTVPAENRTIGKHIRFSAN